MSSAAIAARPRFNPFDRQFRIDPYPTYRALRESDPCHRNMGMWILTRYDDVLAVLRDRRFLSGFIPEQIQLQAKRLNITEYDAFLSLAHQSIVFTDNPRHARLRRLVGQAFAPSRLASFEPIIAAVVDDLVERSRACGQIDAIVDFAEQVPLRVMCRKLGIDASMAPTIARWTREIRFLLEPGLLKRSDFAQVGATLASYTQFLRGLVAERRHAPGEDLISELLAAQAGDERLDEQELVHACIMVFVAGNETTKGLIGNGLAALIDHPDQLARLRERPDLIANAVLEMLRWNAPLQQTKRVAAEPVAIREAAIKAGQVVLLCLGAANRDPAQFPDPDRFDVERDTTGQLGFGFGMHACLGGRVAEREAAIAIGRLLAATRSIEPAAAPRVLQEDELIVRSYAHLPVVLRP
jgi:cytochrome P450